MLVRLLHLHLASEPVSVHHLCSSGKAVSYPLQLQTPLPRSSLPESSGRSTCTSCPPRLVRPLGCCSKKHCAASWRPTWPLSMAHRRWSLVLQLSLPLCPCRHLYSSDSSCLASPADAEDSVGPGAPPAASTLRALAGTSHCLDSWQRT